MKAWFFCHCKHLRQADRVSLIEGYQSCTAFMAYSERATSLAQDSCLGLHLQDPLAMHCCAILTVGFGFELGFFFCVVLK